MKKLLFIATLISGLTIATVLQPNETITTVEAIADDFCDGWEDGYCEGWKDVKGVYAICPITPICPIAEVGKDRYRDGYNRGFKAGSRAAQK